MTAALTPERLPLHGVRVVEFTHMVMGPTCGMILADLGAEVIKVEPPEGDRTRKLPGMGMGFFRTFNRNKKSVVLDLHTPEGLADARRLIAESDVLVENFRPGMMDALGLGYAALSAQYPRLVYASHKGFLPGPYEHRLALDEVVQNMAGLSFMTGPAGRPLRAGTSVNDIMGGMFGAIGVLAALRERERTGRGQEVQSALFENCCLLTAQHLQQSLMTGQPNVPMPEGVLPWSVYDTFTVAGGEQLFIGAVSDKQFQALCAMIGRHDLAARPDLATNAQRVAQRPHLVATLAETLRHLDIDTLCQQLEHSSLPHARVMRPDQLRDDPHLRASGGLAPLQTDTGDTTDVVLLPLRMNGRRLGVRQPLAGIGQHTDEVLGRPAAKPR